MERPLPKFIILVPLKYNDGTEVPQEIIDEFEDDLFNLCGGYTVDGTVKGAYRMDDGSKQIDHSLKYWAVVPEELVSDLERFVGQLATRLGQESMFFERTGSKIEFLPPQ